MNDNILPSSCVPVALNDGSLAPHGADDDAELAALAKALGHPVRLQIIRILNDQSACVCGELVEALPLAQSTVSQHLKVLKDAGLIRGSADGSRVCYRLDPRALDRLRGLVAGLPQPSAAASDEPAHCVVPIAESDTPNGE